jgi:hypothetical protein
MIGGEKMQKDLGMKWLKVCKILWLIGAAISLSSIWFTLICFATVFSAFPAYIVICIALCLVNSFLTVLAYTAVSSFCASRFKYIIALFAIAPISAGVNAYGGVIMADLVTKLAVSGVYFLITALAWSLPNIIYFMHRKHLFTGADPDSDTKAPLTPDAREESKVEEDAPKHVGEVQRVKVTPIRVSPGKSTDKKNATAESAKNKKNILTYSLAALCLALGILCVYQGIQIADLTGKALPWETNRTVLVTAYGYVDSRYHNGNCALSKKNVMRKMSEKEAISSGYKKCHACFG